MRENPTFVLMLGMCPTLAVTSRAGNGLGMGLSTTVVLVFSNACISMLRKVIPKGIRIPAYIVIAASFVTVIDLVMQAWFRGLYQALGVYIPLIVVNCIILGRAEAYAKDHAVLLSVFDGIGMGLGFTAGLTLISILREIAGCGTVFGFDFNKRFFDGRYTPVSIFTMAPGAFFVLAFLCAFIRCKKGNSKGTGSFACMNADCGKCWRCKGKQ